VATIVEDHQPLIGDAVVDGSDEGGFLVVVDRLPYANTKDVTKGVEDALEELAPGLKGLEVNPSLYRPAGYVDTSVDHVSRSLLLGGALLLLGLLLLLFSWRRALTAAVAIAVSFVAAALVLHLFDQTFTAVVFAGLLMALAAIVDDAIAHVETQGRQPDVDGQPSALSTVRRASAATTGTILWATVVLALALVPIFLMKGLSGDDFFPPLAATFLLALVASLVVAATVTPALSLLLLAGDRAAEDPRALGSVRRTYERGLAPVLRRPLPVVIVGVVVLAALAVALPRFDKSLLPPLKDNDVLVAWSGPFGTSLPEMDRITARASRELRALPGVAQVGTSVGQATLGDQAVGSDSAQTWITIDPDADYDATLGRIRRVVAGYPGLRHEILTYTESRLHDVLARSSDEVTVRVFGYDFGILDQKAAEVRDLVAGTDGVSSARVESRDAEPTMQVAVDIAKARAAGLKPGDVRRAAATLVSGLRVGNLFEDQKVFDVVVWSKPESRESLSTVQNLLIDTPTGAHVRLGDVADVSVRPTVPRIAHQDISRYVDVTADVHGRSAGDVAAEVHEKLASLSFPLEYHAELLGDYTAQQNAQRRLAGFGVAAAIGIFLLLQAAFRSWRLGLITFLSLPVALSGGVLAAALDGRDMTLATVGGLLAVLALAVRNALRFVERTRRLRVDDGLELGPELVSRAASDRWGPTLVTAITVALVLLPIIAFGEVAGQEILHPMAVVILGGLVTALLTNGFLLPPLYLRFGPPREPTPLDIETDLHEAETALAGAGAVRA
jgi:Cu/Ag efflux pump CusA